MDDFSPWSLFGTELRKWRTSRLMSESDLARAVPVSHSSLSCWEQGHRPVPADHARRLDDVLGADGHLVVLHTLALEAAELQLTVEQRSAMRLMAALTAGGALPMDALETLRAGLDRRLGAIDLGVDALERVAHAHACDVAIWPPTEVIGAIIPDIADVRHVLALRPEADRAALKRVSAQMSAVLAMALYEAGDTTIGRRWWRTARLAADASGDLDLRVWVRGRQANVEFAHSAILVLDLAAQAERLADGRPSAGLMEALSTRALVAPSRPVGETVDVLEDMAESLPVAVTSERAAIWDGLSHAA